MAYPYVAMTASNTSANALLQSAAPERLRGQSVSLYMLVMRGGLSVGSLLTGVLALGAHIAIGRASVRA